MSSKSAALLFSVFLAASPSRADIFSIKPLHDPERPRSLIFPQLASLILPGFDQFLEGQHTAGSIYLTGGAAGLGLLSSARLTQSEHDDLSEFNDRERQGAFGAQLYLFSGELSAYHSFRTAVETHRPSGRFAFLANDDTTANLLLAPFELSWLARPSTIVPLLVVLGAGVAEVSGGGAGPFTLGDAAFTAGTSYNAGVGEEALFRGYMMPLLRDTWDNDFWSNTATASLFAAAHLSNTNRFPLVQGLLGWYFGWLTQSNGWSVRQAVFIHAWWDVFAIGFAIADSGRSGRFVPFPRVSFTF